MSKIYPVTCRLVLAFCLLNSIWCLSILLFESFRCHGWHSDTGLSFGNSEFLSRCDCYFNDGINIKFTTIQTRDAFSSLQCRKFLSAVIREHLFIFDHREVWSLKFTQISSCYYKNILFFFYLVRPYGKIFGKSGMANGSWVGMTVWADQTWEFYLYLSWLNDWNILGTMLLVVLVSCSLRNLV